MMKGGIMKKTIILFCVISLVFSAALVGTIQAQDNWKVLCDNRTGEITLTRDLPPPHQIVLKQFFPSEPAARAWVNANYPNWRCK
jgi:hypothetical protein